MFNLLNPCPSTIAEKVIFREKISRILSKYMEDKNFDQIVTQIENEIYSFKDTWIADVHKVLVKNKIHTNKAILLNIIFDACKEDIKDIWLTSNKNNEFSGVAANIMRQNKRILHYFTNNNSHLSVLFTIAFIVFKNNKIDYSLDALLNSFILTNKSMDLVDYFEKILQELRNESPLSSDIVGYVVIRIDNTQFGVPIRSLTDEDEKNYKIIMDKIYNNKTLTNDNNKEILLMDTIISMAVSNKIEILRSLLTVFLNNKNKKFAYLNIKNVTVGFESNIEFFENSWNPSYARNYMSSL